jgi:hypothetical protein
MVDETKQFLRDFENWDANYCEGSMGPKPVHEFENSETSLNADDCCYSLLHMVCRVSVNISFLAVTVDLHSLLEPSPISFGSMFRLDSQKTCRPQPTRSRYSAYLRPNRDPPRSDSCPVQAFHQMITRGWGPHGRVHPLRTGSNPRSTCLGMHERFIDAINGIVRIAFVELFLWRLNVNAECWQCSHRMIWVPFVPRHRPIVLCI